MPEEKALERCFPAFSCTRSMGDAGGIVVLDRHVPEEALGEQTSVFSGVPEMQPADCQVTLATYGIICQRCCVVYGTVRCVSVLW